ncbi:MAG: HAMP domain-containing histidine kinase [Alphaproteobacteria bacterium]|nr:HAMP domain-containing histidine kinase [Alphaproteobacteria bacterium]
MLPTIVPLTQRVGAAEDVARVATTLAAARATGVLYASDLPLHNGLARSLGVDGLSVLDSTGRELYVEGDLPGTPLGVLCPPGEAPGRLVRTHTARWAVACQDLGSGAVLAASRIEHEATRTISWLVLGLAAMVGISTAFGVLQILSPLSKISTGLDRVRVGERGVHVDTTGIAELDRLVERLNAAARAMEDREDEILSRIQVVQEIARIVAHEIRNPLQSLELLAGLIAAEDDREERGALAASIQTEVRQLERVVSRMLRGQDGPPLRLMTGPASLKDVLQKVISFRRPEARVKGIELIEGPLEDLVLEVDRTLLSRAVENLVANSLAVTPSGTGRVVVSSFLRDGYLEIRVDDNGPGVPEELGDAIYQAGVSGREGGTGLGLSLVQGVLASHGGYVEHTVSDLGGASFRAWLPLETKTEGSSAHPGGR